jgi:hypothetical protein
MVCAAECNIVKSDTLISMYSEMECNQTLRVCLFTSTRYQCVVFRLHSAGQARLDHHRQGSALSDSQDQPDLFNKCKTHKPQICELSLQLEQQLKLRPVMQLTQTPFTHRYLHTTGICIRTHM